MEYISVMILAGLFFSFVTDGISSCEKRAGDRVAAEQVYCKPKCKIHPVLYKNKDGSCTCNNAVTVEK